MVLCDNIPSSVPVARSVASNGTHTDSRPHLCSQKSQSAHGATTRERWKNVRRFAKPKDPRHSSFCAVEQQQHDVLSTQKVMEDQATTATSLSSPDQS
jgi:hypothetical protein